MHVTMATGQPGHRHHFKPTFTVSTQRGEKQEQLKERVGEEGGEEERGRG